MTYSYKQKRILPNSTGFTDDWYRVNANDTTLRQVGLVGLPGTIFYLGESAPDANSEGLILGPTGVFQYETNEDYTIGGIYIKGDSINALPEGAYIVIDYEEVSQ